jgi:conjugal transfer/type IV secretion protein DotA/TraY
VSTIEPLGWVMAGAFLNTIARMQGMISAASSASIPKTTLPYLLPDGGDDGSIRNSVARDMANFDIYLKKTMQKYSTSASGVACAGMFGLKAQQDGGSLLENLFVALNISAQFARVWTVAPDTSSPCGTSAPSPDQQNLNTVALGIQFGPNAPANGITTSSDPFTQMIALGHSNISEAVSLLDWAIVANTISGATARSQPNDTVWLRDQLKEHTNALFGGLQDATSTASGGVSTLLSFLALVFWVMGFTLAFLLPLMPFMRFLFAVLTWIAALIEAVIAIPLVALAHLNPESEGLSGQQAKAAYFFIFNLFLRPVLMIFGLVAALIIFLIAVSFLNYGYAIAIADSGGTAYGYVFVTRLV